MKSIIVVVVLLKLGIVSAIEPVLIVHGGAGSVAPSRVVNWVYFERLKVIFLI